MTHLKDFETQHFFLKVPKYKYFNWSIGDVIKRILEFKKQLRGLDERFDNNKDWNWIEKH